MAPTLSNPPITTHVLSGEVPSPVWARWLQQLRDAAAKPLVLMPYSATSPLVVPNDWVTVGAVGAPAFQNSFVSFGDGTFGDPQFRKTASGHVELLGLIQTPNPLPAAGTTMFTLPAAYRPRLSLMCGTTGADVAAEVRVLQNGNVNYQAGGGAGNFLSMVVPPWLANDPSPLAASCFPLPGISLPSGFSPIGVLAQCAPVATPTVFTGFEVDWTLTSGALVVDNILGLLPATSYVVTLLAF